MSDDRPGGLGDVVKDWFFKGWKWFERPQPLLDITDLDQPCTRHAVVLPVGAAWGHVKLLSSMSRRTLANVTEWNGFSLLYEDDPEAPRQAIAVTHRKSLPLGFEIEDPLRANTIAVALRMSKTRPGRMPLPQETGAEERAIEVAGVGVEAVLRTFAELPLTQLEFMRRQQRVTIATWGEDVHPWEVAAALVPLDPSTALETSTHLDRTQEA